MDVSTRSVEAEESITITRNAKPVVELVPGRPRRRKVRFGAMRGQIQYAPGWNDPMDEDAFLRGDF